MAYYGGRFLKDDEVILSVSYDTFSGWFFPIAIIIMVLIFYDTPQILTNRGDYIEAVIVLIGLSIMMISSLSHLFMREIIFFRDRIEKHWYFYAFQSIPYSRAKLMVAPRWVQSWTWPGRALTVSQIDHKGSVPTLQLSIHINFSITSAQNRKKVESVLAYLVGLNDESDLYEESRRFEKHLLPDDILSRN